MSKASDYVQLGVDLTFQSGKDTAAMIGRDGELQLCDVTLYQDEVKGFIAWLRETYEDKGKTKG